MDIYINCYIFKDLPCVLKVFYEVIIVDNNL